MLRVRLLGGPVLVVIGILAACHAARGEDSPWQALIESASTEDLIELADEMDFTDPIRANHRLAVDVLSRLLERDLTAEQKPVAHYRRAVFRLKLDDKQAALADVEAALADDAINPEYVLMKGSLLFDLGKAKEGRELATQALSTDDELQLAHQSYQRLAQSADVSPQDDALLKTARPLLAMTPHPYFRSAAAFYKAGDFRASMRRIEQYLKDRPFDVQHSDGAYMILTVASSKCPAEDGARPGEDEVLRRTVFAWNVAQSPAHRGEILKSLLRTLHYAHGETSPGTIVAVSGMLVQDSSFEPRSAAAARFIRSKAYARLGRYSEALAEVELSLKAEGDKMDARLFRIELLTSLEKYEKAIEACDAILKKAPDNIAALLLKAQIHSGCPVAKYRDGKAAVKEASRAVALAEKKKAAIQPSVDPYKMLVLANAEAGDYASADQAVKQLRFASDSLDEVRLINKLVKHVREKKPWVLEIQPDKSQLDRSQKLFQELTASQPNLQIPFLQAYYETTCDELLASKTLTAAQRNSCLRRRSLSRYWQGRTAPAIEDIEVLLNDAPKDDSLYTLLCRCQLDGGNIEAATKTRERLKQVSDGSAAHQFSCDLMQAEIDMARIEQADPKTDGQRDKLVAQTVEKIDQLIRRAPQQMMLYRMRAAARFHAGDYSKALNDNEVCLKLSAYSSKNEMADAILLHARILEKLHRFDHSLQYASMAMALEGDSTRCREVMTRVYGTIGKERLARVWGRHQSAEPPKLQPVADSQPAK